MMRAYIPTSILSNDPNTPFVKLLNIAESRFEALESVMEDIELILVIENASGENLDKLGVILGEERKGRDDNTYRRVLRGKILINNSRGDIETIYRVLESYYEAEMIHLIEIYPASIDIWCDSNSLDKNVYSFLKLVKAAGVRIFIKDSKSETPFSFEGNPHGAGFEVGYFSEVYYGK